MSNQFTNKWYEDYVRKHSKINSDNSTSAKKPKLLDKEQVQTNAGKTEVAPTYRLRTVEIDYSCAHGQELDPDDNAKYAAIKPIADAMVALGFARNDKEFKTTANQRLHGSNPYF